MAKRKSAEDRAREAKERLDAYVKEAVDAAPVPSQELVDRMAPPLAPPGVLAARAARLQRLREEAVRVANDPDDRAESRAIMEDMACDVAEDGSDDDPT